jgi:hypothetical protein
VEQTQELWQKWDDRARRLHPRMEISGEGLSLGPGTVLAGMGQDERGRPRLALDDEPRVRALLATAYERPVDVRLLTKLRLAAELWNDGEKALAHIHLTYASCRLARKCRRCAFSWRNELLVAGVTPAELMKAQGIDLAPLDLLKFNPDQPRLSAGSGRESGEWTSDGAGNGRESGESTSDYANITPVAFRSRREKGRHGRGADLIGSTVSSNCSENRAKSLLRKKSRLNPK